MFDYSRPPYNPNGSSPFLMWSNVERRHLAQDGLKSGRALTEAADLLVIRKRTVSLLLLLPPWGRRGTSTVSYTHLTLPTIYSV